MLKFKSIQALTVVIMTSYWGVRLITHPHHLHLTMLLFAGLALVLSELGYRAGQKESENKLVSKKTYTI